jgi:hypothetical protein
MREYTPQGRRPHPAGGLVTIDGTRIALPDTAYTRLWMIADAELWPLLQGAGELHVDPARIWDDYRPHYDWLRGQLIRRIPGYSGDYPWWSWATPKPDLRARCMYHALPADHAQVRLTLDVPTAEILAFDFQEWHIPLNDGYLSLSEAESDAWGARPAAERTRAALEESWERLFIPDRPSDPEWGDPPERVQAVFETLRLADVARVKPFASRPPTR